MTTAARGLTASELALGVSELAALLQGARVLDAVPLTGDDLLVVFETGGDDARHRHRLHVALGSRRARVTTTARRFQKEHQQTGPRADALKKWLAAAQLLRIDHEPGERRLALWFATAAGELQLVVELFSARGLWALCDARGTVLELSRPVTTAVRTLAPGDLYAPPPPRADAVVGSAAADEPPPRFAPPVLPAIDAHFTAQDRLADIDDEQQRLQLAIDRAAARARKKAEGLREQQATAARAPELRAEADLMLAYLHTVRRGAATMTVPDPLRDGEPRTIELDPARPLQQQAQARYERARRLEDGLATARTRLAAVEGELAALADANARLSAIGRDAEAPSRLDAVRRDLQALGVKPAPAAGAPPTVATAKRATPPRGKAHGENLRRFTSAEGYEILVGRDNQMNDRLTLRIANGNDLWLHVGGGRPGSHVVVRLPKGKTASLETLLDAGTLAVHFSKARGEHRIDVVYTFAKNVRKPKGLPAGAVVPQQTKTLTVRLEPARLQRLLASQPDPTTD